MSLSNEFWSVRCEQADEEGDVDDRAGDLAGLVFAALVFRHLGADQITPKSAGHASGNCAPTGRTAKGELVY